MQSRSSRQLLWFVAVILSWGMCGAAAEPRVLLPGARLELMATEPEIVTPVGMTFDSQGRLLVIESHTHKRPEDYRGPVGDSILMFSDTDEDGSFEAPTRFAGGFQQAMNLLAAGPGRIYLVTRRSVDLLIDDDHDGKMDRQESVLRLVTDAEYPHNGLSGIAHDGKGGLLVGLGENFGAEYQLVGSDGHAYRDRGGVGTIFRCTAAGEQVKRFCNGFWNPFSICVDSSGHVLVVDNDPDASPPCRLIHAVESGDYGHRWEYTRAGNHPLQAWNGELPGTLPMLAGTGEAPCAVVRHRDFLWVTSWGDHRLERYRLTPQGATFVAEQTIAVQGDTDFRPTGCAVGPDGALYFSDWVSHSYPVHGRGRIWRLHFDEGDGSKQPAGAMPSEPARTESFRENLDSPDLFQRQAAIAALASRLPRENEPIATTLALAQATRWRREPVADSLLRSWLSDIDPSVRLYLIRWIADERIVTLRDDVAALLEGDIPDQRYYLSVLSALEWLDGEPAHRKASLIDGLLARELKNRSRSPRLHAFALRLLSPDHPYLTSQQLRRYLQSEYQPLRLEAIRTLALQTRGERFELLAEVAQDSRQSEAVRAEAVAGLAATQDYDELLKALAKDESQAVGREAQRLRRLHGQLPAVTEAKPSASDLDAWNRLLNSPGDAAAGRRLFFSARGARCGICHQHGGRGGKIGPDLSRLSQNNSREQIIASILQPSREMAPHFQPWVLQTDAGKTQVALRLHKSGDGGEEVYADMQGEVFRLRSDEIELRQASDVSIMPDGLEKTVTINELRDLVEFLTSKN